MRRTTSWTLALITLGLVILLGACGSSSSSSNSANTSQPAGSTSTTTTSAGAVDPNAPEVVEPGDIPDDQVFVAFTAPVGGYSLQVPEGWARSAEGATVTFTDHFNTVTATATSAPAAPTPSGARDIEVPILQNDVPGFELVKVSAVDRTVGPAVLITYHAASAPDPVTGKRVALDVERYDFWRNGTQVTLTLSGAQGSDNVDPWKTITDAFAWTA